MQINLKDLFGELAQHDKKILQSLLEAIAENHTPEFGYIQFKKSVQNLQNMDIEELTSIKSAFSTASTMGITKQQLVSSAKKYLTVLLKEKEKFADTLQRQMKIKVEDKIQEGEDIKKTIASHQKKIEQLNKEMALYKQKLEGIDGKVDEEKVKIQKTRDKFVAAFDQLFNEISEDIDLWDRSL